MPLFKFNSHPAPGFHADGSFVVQDTKLAATVRTKRKVTADMCGGGGAGTGSGGYGGQGGAGSFGSGTGGGAGAGSYGDGGTSSFGGGLSGATVDRYNPIRDRLDEGSIVEDWIPRDASGLDEMFKLMYNRDHIAGVIVDLISELIWSDFDLVGVQDPVILNVFRDTMEAIDPITAGPEITRELLVIGRSISSMIFNKERGIFNDIISHDPSFVTLTPIPIKGFDPKIDLIPSPAMRAFVESNDPRDIDARKALPPAYIAAIKAASSGSGGTSGFRSSQTYLGSSNRNESGGGIPLDPINTLFLTRRTFGYDTLGTSLFTRLITFWALEKALINSTMASARRRTRSILHVTAGIDNIWEPTAQEMDNIAGMYIQADEDPVGAVVVTRTGVNTNEIRSGSDFYKWSDEWALLNEGKLRALGANDALLCLSGDTLIPTMEHGIIRIDTFGKRSVDESLTTVGSTGIDTTKKWLYSGNGRVIQLKTNSGNNIKCTPDHQILVLVNNDLVWKKAKDLKLDDYLCISKEKCTRQSALTLDLITPQKLKMAHSLNEQILKPTSMTPDLAYIMGMLVSEGCIDDERIRVSNTDLTILGGVKDKLLRVFGTNINVAINKSTQKDRIDKHGVFWRSNKQCWELCVWSKIIASYFNQLGISISNGTISREKIVPWSILQSDEESQLSYLAAYVDGDGTVKRNGKELVIYSYSNELLNQTQIMLNSHGIDSAVRWKYLRTTCGNAYNLCKKLASYSHSSKFNNLIEPEFPDRGYGIITAGIRKIVNERYVKQVQNVGSVFLNDDGQEVLVRKFGKRDVTRWEHLLYRSYNANEYNDFLGFLKEISLKEYNKILDLFSKKFKYTSLKSIEYMDDNLDVFDIQMNCNPSFVANGLIVHNSGDATYNNQESARMFFMEKVLRLRESLTQKIFYNRLFPLIARIHGFRKRSTAELAHGIRINSGTEPSSNLTQRQALEIPKSQLILPTISWRKELVNKVDVAQLDVYDRLEEKGVPIHLRDWAAAGNVDLDFQMEALENDADIRQQVNKWKKAYEVPAEEGAADEARLEFIHSLKNLAHSNLKQVLGSKIKELGPLSSYIFWSNTGTIGPLKALELSGFLETVTPENNSYKVLADTNMLRHKLMQHFESQVKAEIAYYLIYRTGLTKTKPVLSNDALGVIADQIKRSLDQYAIHGKVYQLNGIAEKELSILGSLSEDRYLSTKGAIDKKTAKLGRVLKSKSLADRLSGSSSNLYSGI